MQNIQPEEQGNDLFLRISPAGLNLRHTFSCGQCFRFFEEAPGRFCGIAGRRILRLFQTEDGILFYDMRRAEFDRIWKNYFDLETDYEAYQRLFSKDETLKKAVAYGRGIRILRQDPFEVLLSFIISQNNNIPRIRESIRRLCQKFGQRLSEEFYTFPTLETLAQAKETDFSDLGLGYRESYLRDCIRRLQGELSLEEIAAMDLEQARRTLRTIKGVGEKVADCALLFGFYQTEAFPVDTWMKKILSSCYPQGFPEAYHPRGIAQQYLFHYVRTGIPRQRSFPAAAPGGKNPG